MSHHYRIALLAAALLAVASTSYAANSPENDAMAIRHARVSLADAVVVAEKHSNGKAVRADYEDSKQGWVYDIEVVSRNKVYDVKVDAIKGVVIAATEDEIDHEDDSDKLD